MGAMGIGGLLNTRNPNAADLQLRHMQQSMHMDGHSAYALDHPPAMAHPHHQHPHQHHMAHQSQMAYTTLLTPQHPQMVSASYMTPHTSTSSHTQLSADQLKPKTEPAPKAFACSTCQKGFARRSDLARHERIHSGVRPHACDFPGCGKQFIQRSALTVHARVHTGEKPHMCERCSKPFSDSSSLARHRRIHSGKRPYQCPFANCQKTFTRRTTLTRHQNNHAGTVEQAEAETSAKLAMTQPQPQPQSNNSSYSEAVTRNSTDSPIHTVSISPNHEMANIPTLQKPATDFTYMPHAQLVPSHLRSNFHPNVTRTAQVLNSASIPVYGNPASANSQLTSHRSGFRPPPTLEPPAPSNNEASNSPHMAGIGWTTDNTHALASPTGLDPYQYQDPSPFAGQALYYPGSNVRRPQSTEPEDYGMRQRFMGHLTGSAIPIPTTEWNSMPMNMHEIKSERAYAS